MGLVDYKKAFDSVEILDVIDALNQRDVKPVYVNVLQHVYRYAKSYIRLHKDSKRFRLQRGVRQCDTSSPKLFVACLKKVFRKQRWEKKGIKIDGEYRSHLRFTDDILIFANSILELQEMLHDLNQANLEAGLSLKKTKVMYNEFAEDLEEPNTTNNNEIEEVDHYISLGQCIFMYSTSKEQRDQTSYHPQMASFQQSKCNLQKQIYFDRSQTPGLRSVYLTNNYLRIRDLESYETTNPETQNYAESP